jgi:cysteine desulfurase
MVALQWANNETGVIQPIAAIAEQVHARKGRIHVDAVQGAGKIAFTRRELGADSLALSAHKLGGPQGVGALILGPGLVIDHKMLVGGGQERGTRAGTENVPGVVGFGAAVREALAALPDETARLTALRDACEAALLECVPGAVVFGAGVERLPNTLCFAIPGLKAETALMAFDLNGVALSSGSACSSGKVKRSHVLDAMGVQPELADSALRFSLGWTTSEAEIDHATQAFGRIAGSAARQAAA